MNKLSVIMLNYQILSPVVRKQNFVAHQNFSFSKEENFLGLNSLLKVAKINRVYEPSKGLN